MANQRNDFKAGLFIITSVILIFAIIIGIKGVGRLFQPAQNQSATFKLTDDIGGLNLGDDVRIGGFKVGVVRDIDVITGADGKPAIEVRFSIPKRYELRDGARVSVQGTLTGASWLNFDNLGAGAPLPAGARLAGNPSAMTMLLASAGEIAPKLNEVTIPKVNNAIDTFQGTGMHAAALIKLVRSKIDPVVERYYAVADRAKEALTEIRDVFGESKGDFKGTVANLNAATGTMKEKLPGIMDKTDGLLVNIRTAVDKTNASLDDVKVIATNGKDISVSIRSILLTNRGKIDSMLASLKATGDNLKFGTAEIRRSPWRLLYKPAAGEMANLNLYDSARQFAEGAGELNDAATSLRDALKDPDVTPDDVHKLIDRLDKSFAHFNEVEQVLWQKVKL
jgi:ABC-type transporter Mla subunit MlaD